MKPVLALCLALVSLGLAPRLAAAADGTVVVEVAGADGKLLPGDVKILKVGTTTVVKAIAALTGEGQGAVAAGDYELAATTRAGGLTGKSRVTVVGGKTQRFRVVVAAPAAATSSRSAPVPTAGTVGTGKTIRGLVKTATGAAATGTVRLVIEVPLKAGAFEVKNLPPGSYRVEHLAVGKPLVTKAVTLGTTDQAVDLVIR